MTQDPDVFHAPHGARLAYRLRPGSMPGVVFFAGFRSDMNGTKALALDEWAARDNFRLLRFDYSGHGRSGGNLREGTIGGWLADSLALLDAMADGPQIIVGSSMGGWLALLAAKARPALVKALVLIAPAPDFTEDLMWQRLPEAARSAILDDGLWLAPSAYDAEPTPITRRLIEEGREHLLLRAPLAIDCPVRILHGMQDPDVPWRQSLKLIDALKGDDVVLTLIKDGDHRLSRKQDLARLEATLDEIRGQRPL